MPLPIALTPPAWEMFLPQLEATRAQDLSHGLTASDDGCVLPLALLRPLAPLFGQAEIPANENFLSGLQARSVLGTGILPASGRRRVSLAWIGVALREGGRLFNNLRGGCWVCGFPAVGRGRELLRLGNLAETSSLGGALQELGQVAPADRGFYFSFHYDEPEAGCDRVYVLDAVAGCLHGFAFPPSALAPAKLK